MDRAPLETVIGWIGRARPFLKLYCFIFLHSTGPSGPVNQSSSWRVGLISVRCSSFSSNAQTALLFLVTITSWCCWRRKVNGMVEGWESFKEGKSLFGIVYANRVCVCCVYDEVLYPVTLQLVLYSDVKWNWGCGSQVKHCVQTFFATWETGLLSHSETSTINSLTDVKQELDSRAKDSPSYVYFHLFLIFMFAAPQTHTHTRAHTLTLTQRRLGDELLRQLVFILALIILFCVTSLWNCWEIKAAPAPLVFWFMQLKKIFLVPNRPRDLSEQKPSYWMCRCGFQAVRGRR